MKKEVADLWIAALESGEYVQTTGALHVLSTHVAENSGTSYTRSKGYCCLGVLCEVAIKNGLDLNRRINNEGSLEFFDADNGVAPLRVMEWAGLRTRTGSIPDASEDQENPDLELTELNDDGKTFKEIAQIIRDNWEKL